jgi:hypothetical protein
VTGALIVNAGLERCGKRLDLMRLLGETAHFLCRLKICCNDFITWTLPKLERFVFAVSRPRPVNSLLSDTLLKSNSPRAGSTRALMVFSKGMAIRSHLLNTLMRLFRPVVLGHLFRWSRRRNAQTVTLSIGIATLRC